MPSSPRPFCRPSGRSCPAPARPLGEVLLHRIAQGFAEEARLRRSSLFIAGGKIKRTGGGRALQGDPVEAELQSISLEPTDQRPADSAKAGIRRHVVESDCPRAIDSRNAQNRALFRCDEHMVFVDPLSHVFGRLVCEPSIEGFYIALVILLAELHDRPSEDATDLLCVLDG